MSTKAVADISAELLEKVRHAPVPIERDGEVVAVVVSAEAFERLELAQQEQETERLLDAAIADPEKLAWLRAEVQKGVDSMERHGTVDGPTFMAALEEKYRKLAAER